MMFAELLFIFVRLFFGLVLIQTAPHYCISIPPPAPTPATASCCKVICQPGQRGFLYKWLFMSRPVLQHGFESPYRATLFFIVGRLPARASAPQFERFFPPQLPFALDAGNLH
jgi:hypothetical protein